MKNIIFLSLTLVLAISGSLIDARCFSRPHCDIRLRSKCYVYIDQHLNWNQAESCCQEWGGHLASIHSTAENYFINYIRNKDRFIWIGLSDTAKNGHYIWTDGSPFDYSSFARGQPDSAGGESCFHMYNKKYGYLTWNDFPCNRNSWGSVKISYICKKNLCPNLPISKCDLVLNGKCYIFAKKRSTWHEAENCCKDWGGHLASIHSELENSAVSSIRDPTRKAWIGLNDNVKEGTYVWTDGTKYDYKSFRRGEPNNRDTGEHCVHLYENSVGKLTWNDRKCDSKQYFVCEKDYTCPCNSRKGRSVMGTSSNSSIVI